MMPIYESIGFGNDLHLFDKKRAFDYIAEFRPRRVPQGVNIDDFKRNSAPTVLLGGWNETRTATTNAITLVWFAVT